MKIGHYVGKVTNIQDEVSIDELNKDSVHDVTMRFPTWEKFQSTSNKTVEEEKKLPSNRELDTFI